jgi:hypothetical protein
VSINQGYALGLCVCACVRAALIIITDILGVCLLAAITLLARCRCWQRTFKYGSHYMPLNWQGTSVYVIIRLE